MVPMLLMVPVLLRCPELSSRPELINTIPELIVTESPELVARDNTVQELTPFHVPEIGADSHDV